jgi:uncharacterized membrane protein
MMYWGNHMTTWDWIFSSLGTLILLALVIVAIVSFVSAPSDRRGSDAGSAASAREILDQRLASGELTVAQYEQLRATLTDAQSGTSDPRPPRPVSAPG